MGRHVMKQEEQRANGGDGGGRKATSVWVFRVQPFQLCCMCEHFIMKDWEETFYGSKEAHPVVLFTPAPGEKSQTSMHLLKSPNQFREAGIIPM